MALVEKRVTGDGLGGSKVSCYFHWCSLCLNMRCELSASDSSHCMYYLLPHCSCHYGPQFSGSLNQNKLFLPQASLVMVFYYRNRNVTHILIPSVLLATGLPNAFIASSLPFLSSFPSLLLPFMLHLLTPIIYAMRRSPRCLFGLQT